MNATIAAAHLAALHHPGPASLSPRGNTGHFQDHHSFSSFGTWEQQSTHPSAFASWPILSSGFEVVVAALVIPPPVRAAATNAA